MGLTEEMVENFARDLADHENLEEMGWINFPHARMLIQEWREITELLDRQGVPADVGGNPTPLERLQWLIEDRRRVKNQLLTVAGERDALRAEVERLRDRDRQHAADRVFEGG